MAITLPSGFNITNNEPVDARFSLADQTARYGLSSANIYEGLVVYQRDNNTLWILVDTNEVSNTNGWQQVTSSELSDTITDRLDSLELTSASHDDRLDQLETDSGSQSGRLDNLELTSASHDSRLGSLELTSASHDSRLDNLELTSASHDDRLDNIESFTSSIDTTIKTKLNVEGVISGSVQILGGSGILSSSNENFTDFSQSVDNRLDSAESALASGNDRLTSLEGFTSSIDTTIKTKLNVEGVISGSDQLTSSYDSHYVTLDGDQTIGGIKEFNDIVVNGTGSFAYIESIGGSAKIIGDAFVVVNTATPTSRYAGLSVYDSGSTLSTASFYFDGQNNDWGYEYSSSTGVDYAVTIFGPEYTTKGNPTYLTTNTIPKAVDNHHLNDSNISDDGTTITLGSNVQLNGNLNLTGGISGLNIVSGSSQILGGTGIVSSSAQIKPLLPSGTVSGSIQVSYPSLSNIPAGIVSGSSQITPLLPTGVVSGSSQVFSNVSGDVTINSSGVSAISSGVIVNADVNATAAIAYTKLNLQGSGIISGSGQITKTLQEVTTAGNTTNTSISITNLTASTSKTTGALIVSGGIGTSGDVFAGGDVVAYASSDKRLKDNILPIENPLQKINQIGGYSFEWNVEKQNIYKGKDYGVIAQEIEEILPELVDTRESGYKAVKYDKLVSLLIEGIKDLSQQVEELKQKINKG